MTMRDMDGRLSEIKAQVHEMARTFFLINRRWKDYHTNAPEGARAYIEELFVKSLVAHLEPGKGDWRKVCETMDEADWRYLSRRMVIMRTWPPVRPGPVLLGCVGSRRPTRCEVITVMVQNTIGLANLSSDEVFAPPSVVNAMLDLLPQELFKSPKTRFLDPFAKSGVFLREIAKRLDRGLVQTIPDKDERLRHIFSEQVYGIAITQLTALFSRRTLYCNKDVNNLRTAFRARGCSSCGAWTRSCQNR